MGIPFLHPKPQPPTDREYETIPQATAGWWSSLTFSWISPLLKTGFGRPLEANDIWRMDNARLTKNISDRLEINFFARCPPSVRPGKFAGSKKIAFSSHGKNGLDVSQTGSVTGSDTVQDYSLNEKATKAGKSGLTITGKDVEIMEKEAAEQEVLQDFGPELGETNLAVDMPVVERAMSLSSYNSRSHRHTESKVSGNTKVQGKALEDFGYFARKLPFTGYKKAVKLAEGRYVLEEDETGKVKLYDQSLVIALIQTVKVRMLLAMACKLVASLLTQTSSLITRQLIIWITTKHSYAKLTAAEKALVTPPSIGKGVGLAIGLALMQEVASLCNNHYFAHSMSCGWQMRACLIDQISRKSLRLSPASRLEFTNGRLTTSVSGDCSFLDFSAPLSIEALVEPISILVGMALLLYYLGYSALVGIAVLLSSTPIMGIIFRALIGSRRQQMATVDLRVRLLSEILNSIRQIKLYAYENYFVKRIMEYRNAEIARLQINCRHRATMVAVMTFLPTAAAVMTFITYGLTGHQLEAATIFSALQVFALVQGPLRILPMAFTALTDAHVAVVRISKLLLANELPHDLQIDDGAECAVKVSQAAFTFETAGVPKFDAKKQVRGRDRKAEKEAKQALEKRIKEARERKKQGLPPIVDEAAKRDGEEKPFMLSEIDLAIPRGAFVVVVGRIGSGKSALLQALIGEMRQTTGSNVRFGGSISYVAQQPWVMAASLAQNIAFGSDKMDHARLARTLHACSLNRDVEQLYDGIDTEIGERGVNLSGGQKARVGLARAVYFDADTILLDDILSAVDSHVSVDLLTNCILDPDVLGKKTRVLVTHHLEVTPHADVIIVVENGKIAQQGSYDDLKSQPGIFQTMLNDFGQEQHEEAKVEDVEPKEKELHKIASKKKKGVFKLMQDEERNTGAVSWAIYGSFFQAMGNYWYPMLSLLLLCLAQVATVGNTLFLGFWSGSEVAGFKQGDYMGIYAGFGFVLALATFLGSYSLFLSGLRASLTMFRKALHGIMRSPVLYHDSTPIGRIISRLSKDIEMIDDRLSGQVYQLASNVLSVFGTLGLVLYTYALLGVIFIPIVLLYIILAGFYRQSSREVKRIDSNQRSYIYSAFGEQLVGLPSIRAYRQQQHFRTRLQDAIDTECRAYAITIYLQRWLGIRLDLLGNTIIAGICLFGVGFANSVSPAKLGVVLTYSLTATTQFSQIVNFYAQVEQEFNNVERLVHTANLPLEAAPTLPTDPQKSWPEHGVIKFTNVKMRYREQMPLVLKGLTFDVAAGEKIGIVGRTGAGKSSLTQVLFRIVELAEGKIEIDGIDLSKVGLDTLRTRLSIIPQEALLFSGTVKENLDPTGLCTDAELLDALRKCDLLPGPDASPSLIERCKKFQLDAHITDEGSNFSAGERQLVALARAVAKRSRVIVLDEATSSVDPETDASIQRTVRQHLQDASIICIAHRLATIAFYDRILVLDHGVIAELDTPLALFDKENSIFRGMCDAAALSRETIVKIRSKQVE